MLDGFMFSFRTKCRVMIEVASCLMFHPGGQRAPCHNERHEEVLRPDYEPQRTTSKNFLCRPSRQSRVIQIDQNQNHIGLRVGHMQ